MGENRKNIEYKLFIKFCKENDIYASLTRQTTRKRLFEGLNADYRCNKDNVDIHCPIYSTDSVGKSGGFFSTKEGFDFWWRLYNKYLEWVKDNNVIAIL